MSTRSLLALQLVTAIVMAGCTSPETRRQESLRAADAAAARGDLERAEEVLRRARAYDPRDALIATRLGQVQETQGRYDRALGLLERFPDEVEHSDWLNLRARLLLRCRRTQEAARIASVLEQGDLLEEATVKTFADIVVKRRLTPATVGSLPVSWLFMLVETLLEEGDPVTALAWMELSGEDLAPAGVIEAFMEHAVASDSREFVQRVDRLISPADSAMETLVHRRALELSGKEAEVTRVDSRFLARYPDHPRRGEILVAEARRHLYRGEAEEALRLVDEALALDGSDVWALVLRGLALEWSGRTKEAERAFRTALAVDPSNRMARESLRSMRQEPGAVVMRIESLKP